MNFIEKINENKDLIGKFFLIISLILLISMFIHPLNNLYSTIDERFSVFLVQLPLANCWDLIIHDVHPPLYYFILKAVSEFLSFAHIPYDMIHLSKILSIVPLVFLFIFSVTKLRKRYNWFTIGLFLFAITTMGDFYLSFLTIRMYTWALLFLIMIFTYYQDVIEYSDKKSWIMLTVLSVLGSYTHYMLIITIGLIYLSIFFYRRYLPDDEIIPFAKKWGLSVLAIIIMYLPGIYTVLFQLTLPHTNNIQSFGIESVFNCLIYYAYSNSNVTISILLVKFIALLLLVLVFILAIKKFSEDKNVENFYVVSGFLIFLFTFIISAIVLPILFSPLSPRYLIPVFALLWLVISICTNNVKMPEMRVYLLMFILILTASSCLNTIDQSNNLYNGSTNELNVLNEINNDNTVVVYTSPWYYYTYHNSLNDTIEYAYIENSIIPADMFNFTVEKNISKIFEENEDKNIVVVKAIHSDKDKKVGNYTSEKILNRGPNWFIKISK